MREMSKEETQERVTNSQLIGFMLTTFAALFETGFNKNRSGWWDRQRCTDEELEALLEKAVTNRRFAKVSLYAAMIAFRQANAEA